MRRSNKKYVLFKILKLSSTTSTSTNESGNEKMSGNVEWKREDGPMSPETLGSARVTNSTTVPRKALPHRRIGGQMCYREIHDGYVSKEYILAIEAQ